MQTHKHVIIHSGPISMTCQPISKTDRPITVTSYILSSVFEREMTCYLVQGIFAYTGQFLRAS